MALRLKDLEQRVYDGRYCTRFEVPVRYGDKKCLLAQYTRIPREGNGEEWNMRLVLERTRDKDSEVYNFGYVMPKSNLPLELIAATGLRYFQLHLKEEIQNKTMMDFALGEVLEGM